MPEVTSIDLNDGQTMPQLPSGLQTVFAGQQALPQFTGIGSMIGVHMTGRPIRSAADAAAGHAGLLDLFYFDLVARGIWFAKRGMMALSIALDEADADKLIAAVEEFAETRAPLFGADQT